MIYILAAMLLLTGCVNVPTPAVKVDQTKQSSPAEQIKKEHHPWGA